MSKKTVKPTPDYTVSALDACLEGAARLNVAIELVLHSAEYRRTADPIEDTLGYDISIATEALTYIRDLLYHAAKQEAREKAAQSASVQRTIQ